MPRNYSQAEMEEILRRALAREADGAIAHADLVDAAREVGIDVQAVEKAAQELDSERAQTERHALVVREHRRGLWSAFGNFVVINVLAFAANAMLGPVQWYHWITLVSGAFLLRRVITTFAPSDRALERAEKRLRKREDRKLKRRDRAAWERNRSQRHKQTAEQFERAVDEGLQAVLRVAADQLEKYNRSNPPDAPRVRVSPAPSSTEAQPERPQPPPARRARPGGRDPGS